MDSKGAAFPFSIEEQVKESKSSGSPLIQQINELSSRLKVIEDRQVNLRRKNQLAEQNMLNISKKLSGDLKTLGNEVHETRKVLEELSTKLVQFIGELDRCAKREDVRLIEKYLEFWSPMHFLTREEAAQLIQERLDKS